MAEESKFKHMILPSGAELVRFDSLQDLYYYDIPENNPDGLGMKHRRDPDEAICIDRYMLERHIITKAKQNIIAEAQKNLSVDKEFLELVYKGKSEKRKSELNKFNGNLSIVHYATNAEKMFHKGVPGAKKQTLNMAFQVGTFVNGNYAHSFGKILKTIMMCQALNISVNIDMFDSDTRAIAKGQSYILANVAKSSEKLNFKQILVASHREFFHYSLFNGYSAAKGGLRGGQIRSFLDQSQIIRDLGPMYDVIGGNILLDAPGHQGGSEMISKILKIGMNGR